MRLFNKCSCQKFIFFIIIITIVEHDNTSNFTKYLLFFMLETTSRQNKILLFQTKIRLPDGRFVFVVFFFNQNVWLIKFSMDSHKTGNQHSDCMEYLEWVVKKNIFERFYIAIKKMRIWNLFLLLLDGYI